MSSVRTKRIVLLWLGTTFLILGGAASAVMSLVDPKNHVSTQIQTSQLKNFNRFLLGLILQRCQVITQPRLWNQHCLYQRALSEQPC